MPYITSAFDGAQIFYRVHNPSPSALPLQPSHIPGKEQENGKAKPTLVFSHGWLMNSCMFDHLILPLVQSHGYRCVSYDRRGFGKSEWAGPAAASAGEHAVTFDVFASDFAQVLAETKCDAADGVGGFVGIGASMGCGELVHTLHLRPDLRAHCRGLVLLGSNLPNAMYDASTNPLAPTPELWMSIMEGLREDRQGFVSVALEGVFGAHIGLTLSSGQTMRFERMIDEADCVAVEVCVGILASADFTEEVRALGATTEFPVLVVHGDADQGFPLEAGPKGIPGLVPRASLKVYENAAHGLWLTHKEMCLKDILQLLREAV